MEDGKRKWEADFWQGLKRQLAEVARLVLFAGRSDWNELPAGVTKPEAE